MTARPKPVILTLTEAAETRVRELMAKSQSGASGLKIGLKKGGCAGMEYTMSYQDEPSVGDEVIEQNGARVFIDPTAVLFLLGARMDYAVEKLSAGFTFNNPNQMSACGCGESVNLVAGDAAKFGFVPTAQ